MVRSLTDRLIQSVPLLEAAGWKIHSTRATEDGSWKELPDSGNRMDLMILPDAMVKLLVECPESLAIVEEAAGFRPECKCDYIIDLPAVNDLGLVVWRKDPPCQSGCDACAHECDHSEGGEDSTGSGGSVN